jgi:AcrR family transcriptional regulator
MVTKTRDKLIEVARQLFVHKGIENTTMNDIANASDKGRRTIYTYFKNKKEIYNAVIEKESEQLVSKLREIADLSLSPKDKLRRFLEVRFDIIRENDSQNDQLMRFFVRDMKRIEKIRRIASEKEREILKLIIQEGVECGQFDQQQCGNLDVVLLMIMQGVDMSYLRDNFVEIGVDKSRFQNDIINFIIESLKA